MADILNVMLAVLNPLTRWEDSVEDILTAGLGVHGRELGLLGTYKQNINIQKLSHR